jgi:hypothetical protein
MIKVQQEGCPIYFRTEDNGTISSATNGEKGEFYTHIYLNNWMPEQLRYVADVLEEARGNGGKLVMEIKGEGE